MRRHKWKLLAVAGLALASVAAFALWPRPNRFTREDYDRIHKGMTRAEVEAILGPPGDYTTLGTDYITDDLIPQAVDLDHSSGKNKPVGWLSQCVLKLGPRV